MARLSLRSRRSGDGSPEEQSIRRSANRAPMQAEAAGFGMMLNIHNSLINPLLIGHGATALALGIFNSIANLFLYSAGFLGPRIAHRFGSVGKTILTILIVARLVLVGLMLFLWVAPQGAVVPILVLALIWTAGEGLVLPLWTAFIAGLVPPSLRGRWLAVRGVSAAASAAGILIALLIVMQFTSREAAIPFAYTVATLAAVFSLRQVRTLLNQNPLPAPGPARSLRAIPPGRERRRFLGGVFTFWFGAGFIWPILPPYIINELGAPTAYFALVSATAAVSSALVQRRWGRHGDQHGPRAMAFYSGIGTSMVPILWIFSPVYYLGVLFEIVASVCWPGHSMSLTMRAIELSETDEDRPAMIAWTSLAQGAGASISPLIAALLVSWSGTIPLLILSGVLRWGGTLILSEAERERWHRGKSPLARRRPRVASS